MSKSKTKTKTKTKPSCAGKAKKRCSASAQKGKGVKKMLKKDLNAFRELLLKKKEEILEGIEHVSVDSLNKSQKDAAGDISAYTYHMADVATDTYDREFSLSLGSAEREMLYEVNESLKSIEDRSYGICQDCHRPIARPRLKAVPYAKLCLKCKENSENS
ncbi:MAG: TraR/DksA family transcriptional regulator [Candidatus Omnitrophota bacterium]